MPDVTGMDIASTPARRSIDSRRCDERRRCDYNDDYNAAHQGGFPMLDPFRKRDNLRPASPGQPGARAPLPGAHAPNPTPAPARADSTPAKPVLLDPPSAPPLAAGSVQPPGAPAHSPEPGSGPNSIEPPQPAPAAEHAAPISSARLIVGPDIKLKGAEIADCDTIMVEGEVDASMDSRVVEIAEQGVFRGKVQVDIAEIRGRFEGELTVHKRLVIRDTGRVSGKIRYGKVSIDEGGELCGDIAAIDFPAAHGSGVTRSLELRTARDAAPGTAQGGAAK
jgi:cytoskeletal protein CcmA (bactofilin family)